MAFDAVLDTPTPTKADTTEDDAILDSPLFKMLAIPSLLVAATVIGATAFASFILLLASNGAFGTEFALSLGD